ncbi:MAG: Ribosomal RNA large subunit methyltransferase K/L [Chlamydiales bacterium]|nr:Ribosomal RNA large subunit methyltransferase K/L [Chlamydiales bacterium]MCH9619246.1 Ribosomal RNA large subunit methyltransferase K/L [Chlamydiales bacterium]MCH9622508.1 Ribosomal RNA large subunit methyltransferase K/L [Chlamydiales bacterium]
MYQLIDSGSGEKFERFGDYTFIRPCGQALWQRTLPKWEADGHFIRDKGWKLHRSLPREWTIEVGDLTFKLKRTDFGHLGIFPEQAPFWERIQNSGAKKVLNLFAYSGGSSLAAAKGGAQVTHVDAAKGMVQWASENAKLNGVNIRWIVEDARKYLRKALNRHESYDGIILDPPTFGRGKSGEVFKIEDDLLKLLEQCADLLKRPKFLLLTCHTPGFTPLMLEQLVGDYLEGEVEAGEMFLQGPHQVPSGSYVYIE